MSPHMPTTLTVRVHLRPQLTMWDALILRVAGPRIRDAFAGVLDAVAEQMNRRAAEPRGEAKERTPNDFGTP